MRDDPVDPTMPPFVGRLSDLSSRLGAMLDDAVTGGQLSHDELWILLHDVATGIEELRVAEEELVVQAEQLAASHQEIDAERERYGKLFEFAPDGYVETDELGKILEANSAAALLLGVRPRFLRGKLVHAFIAERDRRYVRTSVADLQHRDNPVTLEVELVPRNAPPMPAELRVATSTDLTTGESRIRWLIRDITERVKLDEELRQLHADVELLSALGELARLVEGDDRTDVTLRGLATLAAEATGTAAGITLQVGRALRAVRAASDGAASELCSVQVEHGGPGLVAIDDGQPSLVLVDGLRRWPEMAAAAHRLGIDWCLSQPLRTDETVVGVLNLYGAGSVDVAERTLQLLAENAGSIMANQALYLSAREVATQLETALESRGVIEQAKGILMEQQGCGPDEAFDLLRRASQRENRRLHAIAEDLVARAASRPYGDLDLQHPTEAGELKDGARCPRRVADDESAAGRS